MTVNFVWAPKTVANRMLSRPAVEADAATGRGWWRIVRTWADRRRQRAALARLDDRLLADIGITRLQATCEAARPFWR